MTRINRKLELLVFDWDGTVVDSAGHIVASIRAACQDLDLVVPSEDRARHIIGLGLYDALAYLLPALAEHRYTDLADRYRVHFLAGEHSVTLFPGARQALERLHEHGYLLAVATGKSRRGLDRAFETSGVGGFFHATRCADEGFPKPHPDMLLYLMDTLGMDPARTLMIGDTSHDLEMARGAGVQALAVTHGAHSEETLRALAPVACVSSFSELLEWLRANA